MNKKPLPRPCVKCGTIFSTRSCGSCAKVRHAAWRVAHPDAVKEANAARRKKYPKYGAQWQNNNKEKCKQYAATFATKHPDKIKEWSAARDKEKRRQYSALHKQNLNARSAAWRKANPERTKAAIAEWAKNHREARRASGRNRRARTRAVDGVISKGLSQKLFELQKGRCACCGEPLGKEYHLDHVMPLALGGRNSDDNAQLLRKTCNLQKGARHPTEFMQSKGALL